MHNRLSERETTRSLKQMGVTKFLKWSLHKSFEKNFSGSGHTRANFVYFQFLVSKKLAKILQVPNFGGGRIGRTFFNQNFTDRHIRHKIYRQQSLSHVNCAMDFMREFKLFAYFSLHCMFLTLRSPETICLACWRLCCCLHYLQSKKIVLLKPSLQIVASNQIKETSHRNLYKNGSHIFASTEITVKIVRWSG